MRDPHEVLGVVPDASHDEVRVAYRALVRRWHPDRHVGAPPELQRDAAARMAEVTGAFQLLQDPMAMARFRGLQRRAEASTSNTERVRSSAPTDPPRTATAAPPRPDPPRRRREDFDYRRAAASEFYRSPRPARPTPTYEYVQRVPAGQAGRVSATSARVSPPASRRPLVWVVLGLVVGALVVAAILGGRADPQPGAAVPAGVDVGGAGGPTSTLRAGHCFDTLNGPDGPGTVTAVVTIPCSAGHELEVVGLLDVRDAFDDHPGRAALNSHVGPLCRSRYGDAVRSSAPGVRFALHLLTPSVGSWAAGDRRVVCAVGAEDGGRLTGRVSDLSATG